MLLAVHPNLSALQIGGSPIYTGAPFFAAMAALRSGADLVHVFTVPQDQKPLLLNFQMFHRLSKIKRKFQR